MDPFLRTLDQRSALRVLFTLGALLLGGLLLAVPQASALISGEFGIERRTVVPVNTGAPLQYHGGPVLQSSDTYAIYWDPVGSYRDDWMTLIDRYLHDVGADSGKLSNVFSIDSQYTGPNGTRASYNSTFRGAYTDTDPYPANGCPQGTNCLSDAQIRTELQQFIAANHLPTGINFMYFILTPPNVNVCTDGGGGKEDCSYSTITETEEEEGKAPNGICGYHSAIEPTSASPIVYGVQPWIAGDAGAITNAFPLTTLGATVSVLDCQNASVLDEPNQTAVLSPFGDYETGLADVIINGLSVEQNDIVVNPLLNGWYQNVTDAEQSDMCQRAFSPAPEEIPQVPKSTKALSLSNEKINGDAYYLQWGFDSTGVTAGRGVTCWEGTELAPHFTATNPVKPGDLVSFDAGESGMTLDANTRNIANAQEEPFTAPLYKWEFADGTSVTGINDASVYHSYTKPGTYEVKLTVTDSGGNAASYTEAIDVLGANAEGGPGAGSGTSPQATQTGGSGAGVGSTGTPGSPAVTPAPIVSERIVSTSLPAVLRSGLIAHYAVNEQVAGHFEVILNSNTAKRLKLHGSPATDLPAGSPKSIIIAQAILVTTKGGRNTVKIKFSKRTTADLRKASKVTLMLRLIVRNAAPQHPASATVLSSATLHR